MTARFTLAALLFLAPCVPVAADGLGLIPTVTNLPLYEPVALRALPVTVDLSTNLPPAGSQGAQQSCVAWAVGYYYKGWQESVEQGWDVNDPAHQFSPAFVYNQRAQGCRVDNGMSFADAMGIITNHGVAPLTSFPARTDDPCKIPDDSVLLSAWPYRTAGFAPLFLGLGEANIATLKTVLALGQPFVIGVAAYDSIWRVTVDAPVLDVPDDGETLHGWHALLVVGYDDAMGTFKAVNSWGPTWGDGGYGYLSYAFVQQEAVEAWVMIDHAEVGEVAKVPERNTLWLPILLSAPRREEQE